jgi:hypothetical protein
MLDTGNVLLREVQGTAIMIEHVKRGSRNVGFFLFVFLAVNILIFIPFLFFVSLYPALLEPQLTRQFFYTVSQILPTLAVATDPDTASYTQVPLTELYSDTQPSRPQASQDDVQSSNSSPSLGLRPMFSQMLSVRSRFKALALIRGLDIFALISVCEALVVVLSSRLLHPLLAILPQILLPLTLVQIYTLWTHTVLTYPSEKSLWQRIPPLLPTLRATGPALALSLAGKALLRFALFSVYGIDGIRRQGDLNPKLIGSLIIAGAGVELVVLIPAHLLLTRIQAGLLPADERTIVSIDKSLKRGVNGAEDKAVGIREAWTTFGWRSWARLGVLYGEVFFVVTIGGGAVLAADFVFYIFVALMGS